MQTFPPDPSQSWAGLQLPNRTWWSRLSLMDALQVGTTTFVQVPDRLRGAVITARQGTLRTLFAALERGEPAVEELKAAILFDFCLLAKGRSQVACASLLEERLEWWRGGQWSTMWASLQEGGRASPPPLAKGTSKRKAARVHTLASAGEEGRALAAAAAGHLAERTTETYTKLCACFPQSGSSSGVAGSAVARDISQERVSELEDEVLQLLRRAPRLSAPGLLSLFGLFHERSGFAVLPFLFAYPGARDMHHEFSFALPGATF